jgi:hypothetical protein
VPAIDAGRHRPIDGHPAHDALLVTVVAGGFVLRRI